MPESLKIVAFKPQDVIHRRDEFWGQSLTLFNFLGSHGWNLKDQYLALAINSGIATPGSQFEYYEAKGMEEWIVNRLNVANSLGLIILDRAEKLNLELYNQLIFDKREESEPPLEGKYEIEHVPESFFKQIPFPATPVGFFASRLFALLLEDEENKPSLLRVFTDTNDRISSVFSILDKCILTSESSNEFAIKLAQEAFAIDVDANSILGLLFKRHRYEEENNKTSYVKLALDLRLEAPGLWDEAMNLLKTDSEEGWKKMLKDFLR